MTFGRRATFASLSAAIARAARGKRLIGLDVFDTLLRRRVDPEMIKDLAARELARRLAARGTPRDWRALREQRRRIELELGRERERRGMDHEFSLADLAQRWTDAAGCPAEAGYIETHELRLERCAALPTPGMFETLERTRRLGLPIIFVTDVYLALDDVWGLLRGCGLARFFERGYCSSALGLTKRSGRLFEHVLERERIAAGELLFVGDNPHADVDPARRLGIDALLVADRRERARRGRMANLRKTVAGGGLWSAALVREAVDAEGAHGRAPERCPHASLGRLLAPAFTAFTLFVMEQAPRRRLERLYFLSREGATFLRMYRALARARGLRRELPRARYLAVSRAATFLPSLRSLSWAELERMWRQYGRQPLRRLLRNLDLPLHEFAGAARRCGLVDPDAPIEDAEADARLRAFLADEEVQHRFREHRDRARALLLGYLRSRGFCDARKVGLVDIGWKGSIQDNLARAIAGQPDGPELCGLYFALQPDADRDDPRSEKVGFLANGLRAAPEEQALFRNGSVFEMFASARHGAVVGYAPRVARADGRAATPPPADVDPASPAPGAVRPVVRTEESERRNLRARFAPVLRAIHEWFSRFQAAAPLIDAAAAELRPGVLDDLRRYITRPTLREARAFLSYSHVENFGVYGVTTYGFRGSWRRILFGGAPWRTPRRALAVVREQFWPDAVLKRARLPLAGRVFDWIERRRAARELTALTRRESARRAARAATARVAVVIPCFNHGGFLPVAVESALTQTHRAVECVVVDDGSTDPVTRAVLDRVERDGVRVLRQPNRGLSAARNAGVRATDAEFFVPLDADDYLSPRFVEALLAPLRADATLGYAYSHVQLVGAERRLWECREYDPHVLVFQNLSAAAALVRREAFDRVGGYALDMTDGYEDWDFWLALYAAGYAGRRVPQRLYFYRKYADATSMLARLAPRREAMLHRMIEHHGDLYRQWLLDADPLAPEAGRSETGVDAHRILREVEARAELERVLNSRAWRLAQRLAAVGLGPLLMGGNGGASNGQRLPPATALQRVRATPAYRMIQAAKRTGMYRRYARYRYGSVQSAEG